MRLLTSPTVQLGLDLQYPALCPVKGILQLRIAGIHRRGSWHSILLTADLLAPFPMCPALPGAEYYGASAPPAALSRQRACPPAGPAARQPGRPQAVPTFTAHRSAREAPSCTPAASPRLRRRPSPWPLRPALLTSRRS